MRLVKCGVTLLACSIAFATGSGAASARPSHHHRHVRVAHHHHDRHVHVARHHVVRHRHHRAMRAVARREAMQAAPNSYFGGPGSMPSYAPVDDRAVYARTSHERVASRPARERYVRHRRPRVERTHTALLGGFSGNALVEDARRYLGTNPTGRRSLWCGAFMDKVLRDTGHRGGGNLAKGYLHYGHRVSGPQVGAIAVMARRGGGHVGVVSGVDANGNPIIVSGNHNHTVAESVYPRRRIIAYVEPN